MRKPILVLGFLLVTSTYVGAQSSGPESLRGLKGVSLTVDLFDMDGGMDAAEQTAALKVLQDDARALIQKAGIILLKATEIENAGSPHLRMIMSMKKSSLRPPLVTELKLYQQATLGRDPSIQMSLVTWETDGVGASVVNLAMLRSQLSSVIGRFIEDYLAANPK
jgi:hypothetical protein